MLDIAKQPRLKLATRTIRKSGSSNGFQIWACASVEHRGGGIIEWVIEDLPRGSRFLAATVQQADQNSPAPVLGDVVFVQHSAALSADGRKVRLIFEHDSSREISAYASLWLAI